MTKKMGAVVLAACIAVMLLALSACKDSDALKEVIYDQTSSIIDYDNPAKFYINDSSSEVVVDELPASEVAEGGIVTEERQNLVVYSSDPNTQGYTAKQSLWSPTPDFSGIEASSGVAFYETDDPAAPEYRFGERQDEPQEEQEQGESVTPVENAQNSTDGGGTSGRNTDSDGGAGDSDARGDQGDSDSGDDSPNPDDGGGNDGGDDTVAEPEGNNGNPQGNVDVDTTDPSADPPKAGRIAAYGDVAVLVQMIGGQGALAAADQELLSSPFSSVFADEGAADIAVGWSGDGTGPSSINVDAIIESGADTVLVYLGSELTDAEKAALAAAKVKVAQVFTMTNSSYIRSNAFTIGDMLATSESLAPGWDSAAMASSYVSFYDGLIAASCTAANGSATTLAGSSTYENKNSIGYGYKTDAKYTLLLDYYDPSSSFDAKIDGWQPVSDGALLTTVGNPQSPISYYIQAGGLINNAATKEVSQAGPMVAWQFNANIASYGKGKWSYSAGGPMDRSIDVTTNIAAGWTLCPFIANRAIQSADLDANMTNTFGSPTFPRVIVCSQQAKRQLIANSANKNGIYHPYEKVSNSDGVVNISFFGKYTSGGTQVYSSIGVDTSISNSENQFSDGEISGDSVVVNPQGLFASWIGGTSPEAVLEAAWVNDVVNDDSAAVAHSYNGYSGYEAYIVEFYDTFYRFDVSGSLSTIEAGSAG